MVILIRVEGERDGERLSRLPLLDPIRRKLSENLRFHFLNLPSLAWPLARPIRGVTKNKRVKNGEIKFVSFAIILSFQKSYANIFNTNIFTFIS